MTVVKQVWVSCDGQSCGDALGEYDADTFAEARRLARGLGYTRLTCGCDRCQRCTEKGVPCDRHGNR